MKRISLTLFVLLCSSFSVLSQNMEFGLSYTHLMVDGNIRTGYYNYNSQNLITTVDEVDGFAQLFGFTFGYYGPIVKFSDDMAIGGYAGLRATLGPGDEINLGLQIPAMLLFRYGALSTMYSEQGLGVGIGGGIVTHSFYLTYPVGSRMAGMTPNIMAEISFSSIIFRFYYSIGTVNSYYRNYSGLIPKVAAKPYGLDGSFIIKLD